MSDKQFTGLSVHRGDALTAAWEVGRWQSGLAEGLLWFATLSGAGLTLHLPPVLATIGGVAAQRVTQHTRRADVGSNHVCNG